MGPFELMDLIGLDVNFAVTKSVWEAYFHDPRFAPSILQSELVAAGFLGRKTRTRLLRVRRRRRQAGAGVRGRATAPGQDPRSGRWTVDLGAARSPRGLGARRGARCRPIWRSRRATSHSTARFLVPSDGRTATAIAVAAGEPNVVVFDLAYDYRTCTRLAVARADSCSDAAYAARRRRAAGGGIAVSRLDDVAGLVVMRTVAMLGNEAADAVTQGIASARDVDLAMRNGVNYPRGPLAWADAIGLAHVTRRPAQPRAPLRRSALPRRRRSWCGAARPAPRDFGVTRVRRRPRRRPRRWRSGSPPRCSIATAPRKDSACASCASRPGRPSLR